MWRSGAVNRWGKKFDDDDEVQEEVMTWFKGQKADFYDLGIDRKSTRLNSSHVDW
jgi:hypothetical protein